MQKPPLAGKEKPQLSMSTIGSKRGKKVAVYIPENVIVSSLFIVSIQEPKRLHLKDVAPAFVVDPILNFSAQSANEKMVWPGLLLVFPVVASFSSSAGRTAACGRKVSFSSHHELLSQRCFYDRLPSAGVAAGNKMLGCNLPSPPSSSKIFSADASLRHRDGLCGQRRWRSTAP